MPRTVKCALIQCSNAASTDLPIEEIKRLNIEKHLQFIEEAAKQGVEILCMQEIFTTPYFCAEQQTRWYEAVERIPDGPTVRLMQEVAKDYGMVIVVPIYEEELTGIYYNTAAVIDADGKYLGKYRKNHIPHVNPGFWEKFYFRPGNLGYPCFDTAFARIGVYICYDRHFPEGARELGLNGAEIVFNPSATVAGLSEYLWKLEQPAHAVLVLPDEGRGRVERDARHDLGLTEPREDPAHGPEGRPVRPAAGCAAARRPSMPTSPRSPGAR